MLRQIKNIFIWIAAAVLISCGQVQQNKPVVKVDDVYQPLYTALQIAERLEAAWEQGTADSVAEEILVEWNKTIKPNTQEFINQNDTIKAVFEICREFYKPLKMHNPKYLKDWNYFENSLKEREESRHIIIDSRILWSVVTDSSLLENEGFLLRDIDREIQNSIDNFRPPLSWDKNKILYLTPEYREALDSFFWRGYNGELVDEEWNRRIEFLQSLTPMEVYRHYYSFPKIVGICFNTTLTSAKVEFMVAYRGGTAVLKKGRKGWEIESVKLTFNWD